MNHKQSIRIGTVTASKSVGNKYFVSMRLESDISFVEKRNTNFQIGVDFDTDNFLTGSEDNIITNPRYYHSINDTLTKNDGI